MGAELWRKGLERRKGPPPNRASVLQGPSRTYPEEEARGPTQVGLSGLRGEECDDIKIKESLLEQLLLLGQLFEEKLTLTCRDSK